LNNSEIFTIALGLKDPWEITDIKGLHLEIGYKKGSKFKDSQNQLYPAHGTVKEHERLKRHKYTFLKNKQTVRNKASELAELIKLYPVLGEAYRLKELFNDLWGIPDNPIRSVPPYLSINGLKKLNRVIYTLYEICTNG
jgi:hypothetical protein